MSGLITEDIQRPALFQPLLLSEWSRGRVISKANFNASFFFKCPFELPYIGAGLWGWITYPHVARTDLLLDVRLGVVAFVREWKSRGHLKNFQPFQPVGVNPEVEKQICRTQ